VAWGGGKWNAGKGKIRRYIQKREEGGVEREFKAKWRMVKGEEEARGMKEKYGDRRDKERGG